MTGNNLCMSKHVLVPIHIRQIVKHFRVESVNGDATFEERLFWRPTRAAHHELGAKEKQ